MKQTQSETKAFTLVFTSSLQIKVEEERTSESTNENEMKRIVERKFKSLKFRCLPKKFNFFRCFTMFSIWLMLTNLDQLVFLHLYCFHVSNWVFVMLIILTTNSLYSLSPHAFFDFERNVIENWFCEKVKQKAQAAFYFTLLPSHTLIFTFEQLKPGWHENCQPNQLKTFQSHYTCLLTPIIKKFVKREDLEVSLLTKFKESNWEASHTKLKWRGLFFLPLNEQQPFLNLKFFFPSISLSFPIFIRPINFIGVHLFSVNFPAKYYITRPFWVLTFTWSQLRWIR